ncbi:MAG: F0F1 ATP synthase subunit C [Helicobacteraceae bacterium]|nr:F0F1 ATP synthase subunit C [Helicobacteraceae bacterium]
MKKIFLVFLAFMGVAFAADGMSGVDLIKAYSAIGAVVGLGIAALGGAIGMGNAAGAAISGMARNPGVGGKLSTTMFIAIALIEAQVIYTLVIAIIVLYANPLLG